MANNSKVFLCLDRIQSQIHDVTEHASGKDVDFGILNVMALTYYFMTASMKKFRCQLISL